MYFNYVTNYILICFQRFLIPSTRNRHIARAHGIMKYGRKCDIKKGSELVEQDNPADTSADNEFEQGLFISFLIVFLLVF